MILISTVMCSAKCDSVADNVIFIQCFMVLTCPLCVAACKC